MSIKLITVTKTYTVKSAENIQYITGVKNLSIDINEGQYIVVSGPTGSGKSTFLALLCGIVRPSSGEIVYHNIHLSSSKEEKISVFREKYIGFIPQSIILNASMSVIENIIAPNGFLKKSLKSLKNEAERLLNRLGLFEKRNWFPPELSGGERRMVMIVRALVKKPLYIIADEPVSELDSESTADVFKLFDEYQQNGSGVVVATHSNIDVGTKADYYIMRNGEIFFQGKINQDDQY